MATNAFMNRIERCLGKLQSERNDTFLRRKQRLAEATLFHLWRANHADCREKDEYQIVDAAQCAIRSFVRGEGRTLLKRMSARKFIARHYRLDWSMLQRNRARCDDSQWDDVPEFDNPRHPL